MVSRKKIQQTVSGRELIELIVACREEEEEKDEEEEEEEEEAAVSWNCRNSFQAENEQIFGYKRLKQFQFLIHVLVSLWGQFSLLWVYVRLVTPHPQPVPNPPLAHMQNNAFSLWQTKIVSST